MSDVAMIDEDEDDAPPPPPERKEKPEKAERAPRESKAMNELRNNEDRNLKDWLEEIAPGGAIRVKVARTSPKVWKGLNVGGSLATYDQQIDEDWIRDHHGGGDYFLTVQKPRTNGAGWVYAGGRVIKIGGDPRTDDVYRNKEGEQPANGAAPATAIVDRVVGSLERQLEREQERQRGASHGADTETLKMLMQPMQRQMDQMSAMLREKDAQLADAQRVKPVERDEFRDKMLDKLLDGDSARITALRAQYESELRQVKEGAMANESRLRDGFERDKDALARAHERELNTLRSAGDMKVMSQETLATATRTLMEGEIRRLQSDLSEAKGELASLRLKKEKGPMEMIRETNELKEMLGIDDSSKEKSGWEKGLELVGNLPIVQHQLSKLGNPEPAPAPQPPPQVRAPRLMKGPDGNLYRQGADGTLQLIRRRTEPARAPGEEAPPPEIPATTIKVAVDYLEHAFRNQQDPDQVATSVRSMIPAEVLAVIRNRGVDGFLTDVAKLEGTSPLASQAGRNWTRKVGKALLGE